MRVLTASLIALFFVAVGFAQTADELRARLGTPESITTETDGTVKEEYLASPSLKVMVRFSKNGRPEFLRVVPANSTLSDIETDPVVDQDVFRDALDRIVPKSDRGKYLMGTFLNIICLPKNDCSGVQEDFQRLTIHYMHGRGGMRFASITWKGSKTKAK